MSKSILTEWREGGVIPRKNGKKSSTLWAEFEIGEKVVRYYTICPEEGWYSDGNSPVHYVDHATEELLKQLCESDAHYFMSTNGWVRAKVEEEE